MTDPYQILGVSSSATDDEIKKAYRNLCKKYHPDLNPNDPVAEEKFKEVQTAYDQVMKIRQGGYNPYAGGGSSAYGGQHQQQYGYQDPFGFGGSGFRFYATRNNSSSGTKYYMASSGINSNGQISTVTGTATSLILTPMKKITSTDIQQVRDWAYQITNTPLQPGNETSMAVKKEWNIPAGYDETFYQEFAVTVRLMANGVNTGRTMTLNLKNNWQGVFQGLPYEDENGNVIVYTVEENWSRDMWTTAYSEVQTHNGSPPTYSVVITNTYHIGGPQLPATGSAARKLYVLCGGSLMLGSLLIGIGSRRKRERRMK